MKYKIIRKTEQSVAGWTGGKTTELFIFPENTQYAGRNFLFRISSASVEVESSVFTRLPGYLRILMILKGEMEISHQGKHRKILRKFEQDTFDGSWDTSSWGKAVDFNLMMAERVSGSVRAISLDSDQTVNHVFCENDRFAGMYVLSGLVKVFLNDETAFLEGADFLMIEGSRQGSVTFKAAKDSEIIISSIQIADSVLHPSPSPGMPYGPSRLT